MKARMLCFLIASVTTVSHAAGTNFAALIEKAEKQTDQAHAGTMKAGATSETVGFYNNDWLSLRHKKRVSIAQIEVKLKKSQKQ